MSKPSSRRLGASNVHESDKVLKLALGRFDDAVARVYARREQEQCAFLAGVEIGAEECHDRELQLRSGWSTRRAKNSRLEDSTWCE